MNDFPSIPPALMDRLTDLYPNRVPSVSDTDRMVWVKVGEQNVVEKLKQEFARQNKTILQGDQRVSSKQP